MHGYWGMGWGWIVGLIFLVIIFWFIVRTASQRNQSSGSSGGRNALDILKERYARGEIDKEEYESRKRDLM
ncbi:MAG: SHOCT domain-containing protein [Bacteroidales bacterium]